MAYEPTVWKSGDKITSAKLNKVENALSGTSKVYFIDVTIDAEDNLTFNETYQQIADKFADGVVFARFYQSNVCISTQLVTSCDHMEGTGYLVTLQGMLGPEQYVASTPNDYPIPAGQDIDPNDSHSS